MPPIAQSRPSAYNRVATHGGVKAAVPHCPMLMLMDVALERISNARGSMSHRQNARKNRLLCSALQLIQELRASLDLHAQDGLTANLDDQCEYMGRQLVSANMQNRAATLDEVSGLLYEIRSAWVTLPPQARSVRGHDQDQLVGGAAP